MGSWRKKRQKSAPGSVSTLSSSFFVDIRVEFFEFSIMIIEIKFNHRKLSVS